MSEYRRAPSGPHGTDITSIKEFVRGYQQAGLRKALAAGTPFAVVGIGRALRKGR